MRDEHYLYLYLYLDPNDLAERPHGQIFLGKLLGSQCFCTSISKAGVRLWCGRAEAAVTALRPSYPAFYCINIKNTTPKSTPEANAHTITSQTPRHDTSQHLKFTEASNASLLHPRKDRHAPMSQYTQTRQLAEISRSSPSKPAKISADPRTRRGQKARSKFGTNLAPHRP